MKFGRMLLWGVLAMGAASGAAPFSHRTHARLGLLCVTCHAAATTSTRVEDSLLPDRGLCLDCHKQVLIPPPARTPLAHFSHELHLKLPDTAKRIAAAIDAGMYLAPPGDVRKALDSAGPCVVCHRAIDESARATSADLPRMADCLVCHSRIQPPASCQKCHPVGANLKPANHTADFLKSHTTGKLVLDKSTCVLCHGRKFTCQGCH